MVYSLETFVSLWGLLEKGAAVMLRGFRHSTNRLTGKATTGYCSAWVLCALLLVFSAKARLAPYEVHKLNLNQASAQTYVDSEEARRKLPHVEPLCLICVAIIAVFRLTQTRAVLLSVVIPNSLPFKGFDPESCLRPPPVR